MKKVLFLLGIALAASSYSCQNGPRRGYDFKISNISFGSQLDTNTNEYSIVCVWVDVEDTLHHKKWVHVPVTERASATTLLAWSIRNTGVLHADYNFNSEGTLVGVEEVSIIPFARDIAPKCSCERYSHYKDY
jgi:hypothetical protein